MTTTLIVISIAIVLVAVLITGLPQGLVSISSPTMTSILTINEMSTHATNTIQLLPTPSMATDSTRLYSKPQLKDLIHMKSAKEHEDFYILDDITRYCQKLGYLLELREALVNNIWNRSLNPLEKCQETVREWLEGKGSTPVTWATFIKSLDRLELRELSNKLRQELK